MLRLAISSIAPAVWVETALGIRVALIVLTVVVLEVVLGVVYPPIFTDEVDSTSTLVEQFKGEGKGAVKVLAVEVVDAVAEPCVYPEYGYHLSVHLMAPL